MAAGYPPTFADIVICNFKNDKVESVEDDFIIPPGFFVIVEPAMVV